MKAINVLVMLLGATQAMSVKTRGKSVIHLKMIKMQRDDGAAVAAEEDNDAPDRLTYGINNRTIPEWDEKVHW